MEWVSEKEMDHLARHVHMIMKSHVGRLILIPMRIYIGLRLLPVWADSATLSHVTVESVSAGSPADQNGIHTLPW